MALSCTSFRSEVWCRTRGTRECSFCSNVLTRARISVTICTPLDFETLGADELEVSEGRGSPFARGVLGAGSLEVEPEVGGTLFAPGVVGAALG